MALAFQIAAAEGGDSQGNAIGAISVAIVVPQVKIARQRLVSAGQPANLSYLWNNLIFFVDQLLTVLTTGPIDNASGGGGNTPGFIISAALAFLSWFLGLLLLSKKVDLSCTMPML
jgi:hypothetical protein